MEKELFILDIDYILDKKNHPIIRIFCKDENGNDYIILYKKFLPYFFVLPKDFSIIETSFGGKKLKFSLKLIILFIEFSSPGKILYIIPNIHNRNTFIIL